MDFFFCPPQHTLSHWKAVIINGHKVYTMRSKQSSNVRCRIATALPPLYFCVFSVRQAIGEVLSLKRHLAGRSQILRGFSTQTPPYLGWEEPTWESESGPGVAPGPGVALWNISLLWGGRGTGGAREEGVRPERQEKNQEGKAKNSTEMIWKRGSGLPSAAAGRSREIRLEVPWGWPFKGPL